MSEERAREPVGGGLHHWVGDALGVRLVDPDGAAPPLLCDLAGLAVRRNPRRAHLVVSRVLGKHLPVDPRLAYAAARLLGERAAAALGAPGRPGPLGPLADALRGRAGAGGLPIGAPTPGPVLVVGYAETATALGHAVADAFVDARYLHSTRRAVPGTTPLGSFDEAHSHATEHLLLPADPGWLRTDAPVVLVDDELTTGRTAAQTIRALHAVHPRGHYVLATLLDLRPWSDRGVLDDAAKELDTRIDVVALGRGEVELPDDVLARGRDLVAALDRPPAAAGGAAAAVRRIAADWPVGLPEGGRHGFDAAHREALAATVGRLAVAVGSGLPADARVLVLGTEELMYTPLLLAVELARHRPAVRFSSTTRSPVLPVDADGYAIRTRLQFTAPDDPGGTRFAYNVAGAGFDAIVVVVDRCADTPALWAPDGLVEALRRACGGLTVAVVPDHRPAPTHEVGAA